MGRTFYYKGIQLPQLRSFCSVASAGSFTGAARVLGLSKPTVWQQVRALERQLGVELIAQRGRRTELTAEGQLLLGLIQPHVSGLDSLVRLFETQRGQLQQKLTVASTPYLIAHHLPAPVQEFTTTQPSVRLQLRDDLWTEAVFRLVEQGQADMGVVPYMPAEPRNQNLEYHHLFEMQFTLLTAARHPLAKQKRVGPHDLVKYPIIKAAGYNLKALETALRRHELMDGLHVVMESSNTDIIRRYVILGVGIAVLYMGGEPDRPPSGLHLRRFDPETPDLGVAIVVRRGAHLPPHVQEFCQTVRKFVGT